MKTCFRLFVFGLFMVGLTVAMSTSTFAQDPEKVALYAKYTDNYAGTIEQRRTAIKAAKEYIQKYQNSADDKEIVAYLKGAIPTIEEGIKKEEDEIEKARKAKIKKDRYDKFDVDVKAKNWGAAYQSGEQILAAESDFVDIDLVLGSIGLDELQKTPSNDAYVNSTVKHAKTAISKLERGVTSRTKKFGAYSWEFKTKDNALGWMNYTIGMIMYHSQGKTDPMKKKGALNYLYAATRFNSDRKQDPSIYGAIGDWYFDKALDLGEIREKLDKKDEANFKAIDDSILLEKAYVDRALDAYARALQIARGNPKTAQPYKDGVLSRIKQLYDFRYQEPEMKTETKINMFISGVMAKTMPNPASEVKPIAVPKPAETENTKATDAKVGATRTRKVTAKTGNR